MPVYLKANGEIKVFGDEDDFREEYVFEIHVFPGLKGTLKEAYLEMTHALNGITADIAWETCRAFDENGDEVPEWRLQEAISKAFDEKVV